MTFFFANMFLNMKENKPWNIPFPKWLMDKKKF